MADTVVGNIVYNLDVNTTKFVQGMDTSEKKLDELGNNFEKADESAKQFGEGLNKITLALKALIAASALREIASMVQGYQEMADRVRLATSSTEEFNMVQARLVKTANGTYRSLGEAQELYIRTADSLRSMGYSTSQALDVTDSMSYAFVTNAANAEKAAAATDAFAKILAKGKVEADAWETILAATPSVIQAVADATGKTTQEVRNLGATGKLSAADLTEGLRRALDATAVAAAGMSNNLTDAATRTRTALTAVFVEIENQTGAWQKLTDGIITAADWMLNLAGDNESMTAALQAATTAAAALSAVIAGRIVSSFASFATAQALAIRQSFAQAAAAKAVATANTSLAATEYQAAKAALDLQRAVMAAGGSMAGAAADATALAAAEVRVTAAQTSLNTAMAASAGIATRASVAMGALRTVMGFLGGPVGVILLAATALYAFATASDTAKTKVDALNGSLENLTFNQLSRSANEIGDDITGLNKKLSAALNESNTMTRRFYETEDEFKARQANAAATLDDLNQELKIRKDRLLEIAKAQDRLANPKKEANPTVTNPTANQRDPDAQARIDDLKDEKALLQVVGEARAKLRAVQKLGDNATPEQKKEAEELAAAIYNLEQAEAKQKAAQKKGESEAAAATKKSAAEQKKGIEENQKQFAELGQQIANVGQSARDAAMDAAQLSLNKYATPEQIEQVRTLAGALYDLKEGRAALAAADPIAGEQISYEDQLKALQALNDQKLLSDQRYIELKGQAERTHLETMKQLQEENFRAATKGNELLMAGIDGLASSGTQALSGLLSGTSNLKDALGGVANTVLNTVIGSFVQAGQEWVKQEIIKQAATQATEATQIAGMGAVATAQAGTTAAMAATTTTTAATTGASVASSMAPAAGLSSIASFGGAAVIGGAALLATMLLAKSFGGGRQYGGGVSSDKMYRINETGPEILTDTTGKQYLTGANGKITSNADAFGGSGGGGSTEVNIHNYSGAPVSQTSTQLDGKQVIDIIVGDMAAGGKTGKMVNQITGTQRKGS